MCDGLLFNLYLDKCLKLGNHRIKCVLYADNTVADSKKNYRRKVRK